MVNNSLCPNTLVTSTLPGNSSPIKQNESPTDYASCRKRHGQGKNKTKKRKTSLNSKFSLSLFDLKPGSKWTYKHGCVHPYPPFFFGWRDKWDKKLPREGEKKTTQRPPDLPRDLNDLGRPYKTNLKESKTHLHSNSISPTFTSFEPLYKWLNHHQCFLMMIYW